MINLDRLETIYNKAQELNRPEIFQNALAKVLNNNKIVVQSNRLNQIGQLFSSRMKNYQFRDDVRIIVYPLGFTLNNDLTLSRPFGPRTYIVETDKRILGNYLFLWPKDMSFNKSLHLDRETYGQYVKEHHLQQGPGGADRKQIYKQMDKAYKEDVKKQQKERQAQATIQRFYKKYYGHYFKYYGGTDWDGQIINLKHAQIGSTKDEHIQLSKTHCFIYALEQNQIDGKNISTEQIEQIRCQLTSENLSSSEFKKIDTDVQIEIYNVEDRKYIRSRTFVESDDDKNHIRMTLWMNHYFYDKKVYVCDKVNSKAKKPLNTIDVLKRLIKHNRWTGELNLQELQDTQEPIGETQDPGSIEASEPEPFKFKLNFNDQRPYQKQEHNQYQLGIVYKTQEQMMDIINKHIQKNQDTGATLTYWKDNGIIYTISINGKVKYKSYDCYGVKDQAGFNKLLKVKPEIMKYQSIGQFTIDQNIDLSDTYEMTRSLEEFFRAAFTKPFMLNQPGSYHDVVLLDMNSMYPYGLKESGIYLGKAEPYQGGEYGILYNGQEFLFDHEAQEYYYSHQPSLSDRHEQSTDWVGVQFYGKRDVSKSIDKMYELKGNSSDDERGVFKLMLNSLYGRLGYKHENHQWKIEKKEKFQHRLVETNICCLEWEELDNDMISYREKSEIIQSFYNQAHQAAALLHYANQHYWKLVNKLTKPEHIIYANTDSIMVETKNINQIQDSKQIGQFKVEALGDAYIIKHNMYTIYKDEQIIKQTNGGFKGTISLQQIKNAMNGQSVVLQQEKVCLTQYGFEPVLQNYKL